MTQKNTKKINCSFIPEISGNTSLSLPIEDPEFSDVFIDNLDMNIATILQKNRSKIREVRDIVELLTAEYQGRTVGQIKQLFLGEYTPKNLSDSNVIGLIEVQYDKHTRKNRTLGVHPNQATEFLQQAQAAEDRLRSILNVDETISINPTRYIRLVHRKLQNKLWDPDILQVVIQDVLLQMLKEDQSYLIEQSEDALIKTLKTLEAFAALPDDAQNSIIQLVKQVKRDLEIELLTQGLLQFKKEV